MDKLITIDGLSSSGKSTLSQLVAKKLNWHWISTGVIYRGISFIGNQQGFSEEECIKFIESEDWTVKLAQEKTLFFYKEEDITSKLYTSQVDEWASLLSKKANLRKKLIRFQQEFFQKHSGGLIAEGRDCGTIIFEKAPLKFFLQADEKLRASRRYLDRTQNESQALEAQKKRDRRDETRSFAPALQPKGSIMIDTRGFTIEEMVDYVCSKAREKGLVES